jgi:hypothetical protein
MSPASLRSLASLGNCSCIALIPSIPGHMLPPSAEGGCTCRDFVAVLFALGAKRVASRACTRQSAMGACGPTALRLTNKGKPSDGLQQTQACDVRAGQLSAISHCRPANVPFLRYFVVQSTLLTILCYDTVAFVERFFPPGPVLISCSARRIQQFALLRTNPGFNHWLFSVRYNDSSLACLTPSFETNLTMQLPVHPCLLLKISLYGQFLVIFSRQCRS